MKWRSISLATAALFVLSVKPPPSLADFLFSEILDTSALIGHPAAPFYIEFQLNDGLGIGDGNNLATISDFEFSGGSALGTPTFTGGSAGNLSDTVTLRDSAFFNEFYQEFKPGPILSFDLDLTINVDPGPQPDQFSFAILDCNFTAIPTLGPADALLAIDINSTGPVVRQFSGDTSRSPACGGSPIAIGAIPEPADMGFAWLALAISGIISARTRRQRGRSPAGAEPPWDSQTVRSGVGPTVDLIAIVYAAQPWR